MIASCFKQSKDSKGETLTCSPDHPFFVDGQGWVAAGELSAGSRLTSRSGAGLSVSSVTWQRQSPAAQAAALSAGKQAGYAVYNFEVEKTHSYFVGNQGGGTWVHNLCEPTGAADSTLRGLAEEIDKRYPGLVKGWGEGHMVNGAQVDIELENALIEVKSGNGQKLTQQISARMDPNVNPNGLPVIGYAPNMGAARNSINAAGGIAAGRNDWETLMQILAP